MRWGGVSGNLRSVVPRWLGSVWLALAAWSVTTTSSAAADTEADRAELSEQLLQRGREAFEAKRYEEAHSRLSNAYRLHHSYRTACTLGQVELELEMFRDAAEHLDVCISRYPAEDPQQARDRVLDGLRETRRHVAVFEPTVNLLGATILVNGVEVATTPLRSDLFVEPGLRRITVRKPGYRDVSAELFFPAGGTTHWRAELLPQHSATAPSARSTSGGGLLLGIGTALTALTLASGGALSVVAYVETERATEALARARESGSCTASATGTECTAARRQQDEAVANGDLATGALWVGAGLGVATAIVHWAANGLAGSDAADARGTTESQQLVQPIVHPSMIGAIWSRQF